MKKKRSPNQRAFKITKKNQIVIAPKTEEPVPEIDTAKAVSFAMSIAEEMKKRQREEDARRKDEKAAKVAAKPRRYSVRDLQSFEKRLVAVREELLAHSRNMTDSVGLNSAADIEPDNGDGTSQTMRLEAISQIEKANKSINDVEESLRRVADGSYGVCMTCGGLIARERLIQSPFVKTCTACQHRLEQRGE